MKEENNRVAYEYEPTDEIELRDIILPIWQAKYRILIISILMAGLVLCYHLIRYSFTSPSQYSVAVNFNFEGVEKAMYPNGVHFSPNDLLSNNIFRRVYDELQLSEKEVDFSDFSAAITIKPGFYGEDLLKSTAIDIASKDKKITVEDFNQLVATYTHAINIYSRQSAIISLDNSDLHFNQQQAEAVLLKIPEIWAEFSIQELGVMNVFSDLVTIDVSQNLGVEPLVMVSKLADYSALLKKSLTRLEALPRAHSIVEKKSRYSINDLAFQLKQIDKYQVNTLRAVIIENESFSNDLGLHESFRAGQLAKLHREKGELVRMIKVYDEITEQFDQLSFKGNQPKREKDNSDSDKMAIYSPQYGDALVNNLLELGSKMADPAFRKDLLNEKITLALKLQEIETEIEIFSNNSTGSKKGNTLSKAEIMKYIAQAGIELDALSIAIASIVEQFNSYAYNNQGSLYSLSGDIMVREGYMLNDPKLKLKLVVGFILGGMIAVFWVWGRRVIVTNHE